MSGWRWTSSWREIQPVLNFDLRSRLKAELRIEPKASPTEGRPALFQGVDQSSYWSLTPRFQRKCTLKDLQIATGVQKKKKEEELQAGVEVGSAVRETRHSQVVGVKVVLSSLSLTEAAGVSRRSERCPHTEASEASLECHL